MPASATVLDGGALAWVSRAVEPEARVAVPWLFQIEVGKETLGDLIDSRFARTGGAETLLRAARDARADAQAEPGLTVLIVGESLRTDALIRPERGAASKALQQRLEQGLGLRLPDVCAGGNATFVSVPKRLTLAPTPDPAQAVGRPTVLAIARAAGAQTAYFNNHDVWVVPESGHDRARKFSSAYFPSLDEVAIEALEDFVRSGAHPSRAAVLHLYGQHFHYPERYPPGLFGPEPGGLTVATLAGAPDGLRADLAPQTWGSLQAGERAHAVSCAALGS